MKNDYNNAHDRLDIEEISVLRQSSSSGSSSEGGRNDSAAAEVAVLQQLRAAEEHYEQVQALIEALGVLSQLAALDSTTAYQVALKRHRSSSSSPSPSGDNNEKDPAPSSSSTSSSSSSSTGSFQEMLDNLNQRWRLEETPVPQLASHIHRMHSTITSLHGEVDQQASEIECLKSEIEALKTDKRKVAKVCKALHAQNENLSLTLQKTQAEKRALVKHVKARIQQLQEKEEQKKELLELNHVYRIHAHEQVLQKRGGGVPNRVRTATDDSCSTANCSDSWDPSLTAFLGGDSVTSTTLEEDDVNSFSSFSSLVTDDGVAAVKFSLSPQHSPIPASYRATTADDDSSAVHYRLSPQYIRPIKRMGDAYTIKFARGKKIGLKIRPILVVEDESVAEQRRSSFLTHKGLLTTTVLAADDSDVSGAVREVEKCEEQQGFSLSIPGVGTILGSNGNNKPQEHQQQQLVGKHAFRVCGYTDEFDASVHRKPEFGARIVEVNGEPVDESWTMKEFMDHLRSGNTPTFSVTFRDEILNKGTRELISVSSTNERSSHQPSEARPQSPKPAGGVFGGFLNNLERFANEA